MLADTTSILWSSSACCAAHQALRFAGKEELVWSWWEHGKQNWGKAEWVGVVSHPWKHSRSGWMGLWKTWLSWRCPYSLQGGWTRWSLKVPSNTNYCEILWKLYFKPWQSCELSSFSVCMPLVLHSVPPLINHSTGWLNDTLVTPRFENTHFLNSTGVCFQILPSFWQSRMIYQLCLSTSRFMTGCKAEYDCLAWGVLTSCF